MNTEAFRSIAVVGQLQTGKICSLLGEKFSVQRRGPLRYKINSKKFPRLKGYVLTIYSKLNHLNLDMSERTGVIVLNPDRITSLCGEQRFKRHKQFFEMLGKLCWLGVDRYIIVVNQINDPNKEDIAWFESSSQNFSKILEEYFTYFDLKVEARIPVGRKDNPDWYNIFSSESWYPGPCLVESLENLISTSQQIFDHLWAVGLAIPKTGEDNVFWLRTERISRGTLPNNTPVQIFLDNVNASERLYGSLNIGVSRENAVSLSLKPGDGMLQQASSVVLVSSTVPTRYWARIKVDALLKDGLTIDELNTNDLNIIFFGPQNREGQISNISTPNSSPFHPSLGQRLHLELEFPQTRKPVMEPFFKDPDAGRVLICQKDRTGSPGNLLGVGRILSSLPDYEIKHLVAQLIQIDELQFTIYQNHDDISLKPVFWTQELELLIHDMKNLVTGKTETQDYAQCIKKFSKDFERIIGGIRALRTRATFENYKPLIKAVITHLDELKRELCDESFQELKGYIAVDGISNSKLSPIVTRCEEIKAHINRRTTKPIQNFIIEAIRFYEQREKDFDYDIHDLIPDEITYYPRENLSLGHGDPNIEKNVVEAIKDTVIELLNNSVKHSKRQDLRIHIFIDPPSIEEPAKVKVWLQDNGILTKKVLTAIQKAKHGHGWRSHKEHLKRYNIELGVSESAGFGTTCFLTIPIWSKSKIFQNLIRLVAALHHVDYEGQERTGSCPDFFGRFSNALDTLESSNVIQSKLQKLCADIEQEIKSLTYPPWVKQEISQLDRDIDILVSQSNKKIPQHMKNWIQILQQQHPILSILRDTRNKIWKDIEKEEDLICTLSDNFPAYRLRYPTTYFLVKNTLIWGFKDLIVHKEGYRSISIECQMAGNDDEIRIIVTGPGMSNVKDELLPFRTRLKNLGIDNCLKGKNKDILILSIPIWKIFIRR